MELLGWMAIPRRDMEKALTTASFKNEVEAAAGRSRAEATHREFIIGQVDRSGRGFACKWRVDRPITR